MIEIKQEWPDHRRFIIIDDKYQGSCQLNIYNVEEHPWMGRGRFDNPHIVVAVSYEKLSEPEEVYFAPAIMTSVDHFIAVCPDETETFWFGLGNYWGQGRLDLDGTLTENLEKYLKNVSKN